MSGLQVFVSLFFDHKSAVKRAISSTKKKQIPRNTHNIAWVALERLGGKNGFRLYIEDLANHITSLNHIFEAAASVDFQKKERFLNELLSVL